MSLDLRPMSDAEYEAWLEPSMNGYAQSFVDSGIMSLDKALERSAKDFRELLPEGKDSPDHAFWTAWDAHVPVGSLWAKFGLDMDPRAAFIYDISVREDQRRRGHGRAMIDALAVVATERGMTSIRLNVFGHNAGAIALYQSMGFVTTNLNMKLPLDG